MSVQLVNVYFSARSLVYLLSAADVVEVTVGEEYLCKAELLHFEKLQKQTAVAADIHCYTASGGSLDYIAV